MERTRSNYDADQDDKYRMTTGYQATQNQNVLYCSSCGESVFVNDLIFGNLSKVIDETLENPFLCEDCIRANEEFGYSGF